MDAITSDMLERLARRRRFAVRTLHVAKRLLVDRVQARAVAAEFGLHLSRVYAIRQQVRAAMTAPGVGGAKAALPSGIKLQNEAPRALRPDPADRANPGRYG